MINSIKCTQLARSQVTYFTSRNEHIWPLTKVFTLIESFLFDFLFFLTFWSTQLNFWAAMPLNFYIYLRNNSLALASYILNIFCSTFSSQTVFEARFFQIFLSLKIDVCRAFWHKNKCEEIYRNKSTHVSRSNKTID